MALTKVTQHSLGNSAVTTAKLGTAPFGFANSSANVVYMAANGNVGIGTSAPSILMHVSQSNTGGDIGLLVSQGSTGYTNASSTATLYLGATGSLAQASRVVASHSDGTSGDHGQNLQLWTVNSGSTPTERMRITSAGYVVINASTVSGYVSSVTPKLLINAGADSGSNTIQNYPVGLAMYNGVNADASNYGVAIKFHFSGGEAGKYSAIAGYTSRAYANGTGLRFYTNPTGENGADNNAQRMQIDHSGNIGAGGSSTNIYNASDRRLKKNIIPLINSLEKVKQLEAVQFNWADGFSSEEQNKTLYGFVAQDVQNIDANLIEPFGSSSVFLDQPNNLVEITNPLRINEKFIIALLVRAIQEQDSVITDLTARIAALESNA